jgi:hypothetical protein
MNCLRAFRTQNDGMATTILDANFGFAHNSWTTGPRHVTCLIVFFMVLATFRWRESYRHCSDAFWWLRMWCALSQSARRSHTGLESFRRKNDEQGTEHCMLTGSGCLPTLNLYTFFPLNSYLHDLFPMIYFNIILSLLRLPYCRLSCGFSAKTPHSFLFRRRVACFAHLIVLLVPPVTFAGKYGWWIPLYVSCSPHCYWVPLSWVRMFSGSLKQWGWMPLGTSNLPRVE